jgi:hypothetical protein
MIRDRSTDRAGSQAPDESPYEATISRAYACTHSPVAASFTSLFDVEIGGSKSLAGHRNSSDYPSGFNKMLLVILFALPRRETCCVVMRRKVLLTPQSPRFAIMTKERSKVLPNVPTGIEQGVPNLEAYTWNAIFLPKGAPAEMVNTLNRATALSPSSRSLTFGLSMASTARSAQTEQDIRVSRDLGLGGAYDPRRGSRSDRLAISSGSISRTFPIVARVLRCRTSSPGESQSLLRPTRTASWSD